MDKPDGFTAAKVQYAFLHYWNDEIVKHDNITDPSNLLIAAQSDLGAAMGVATTITLTAADLSKAGYEVNPFSLGTYAKVEIENLNIDANMLIRALNVDLLNPAANNITLGKTTKSLTSELLTTGSAVSVIQQKIESGTLKGATGDPGGGTYPPGKSGTDHCYREIC